MENVTVIQSHRAYSWRQCFMTIILKIIITYKKNSEYLDFDRRILCCLSRGFHPSKWKETSSWCTNSSLTIIGCVTGAKKGGEGRERAGRGGRGRNHEREKGKEVPFLVCPFPLPLSLSSFPPSFWRLSRWLQLAGREEQGDICTHLNFIFDFLPRGVYTGINMANLKKINK